METPSGTAGSGRPDPGLIGQRARSVLDTQIRGIRGLEAVCDRPELATAVAWFTACRGRILVSGVGKSGIVASKIAASMRSTGTPAIYMHPVEAVHGDVGLIGPEDLGLFLSKSGESRELLELVPALQRLGVPIVSIVTRPDSTLGRHSDLTLDVGHVDEAGPIPEIPSTSTTVFQVLGDILTLLVVWEKGLTPEQFSFLHPGGVLGQLTARRVADVMHSGDAIPMVVRSVSLQEALVEMIDKRLGMTTVVDAEGRLVGILTDGDIRRILHRHGSIEGLKVADVMTGRPKTIRRDQFLAMAVHQMETNPGGPITSLVVVDAEGRPDGVIHLHDCLRLGVHSAEEMA